MSNIDANWKETIDNMGAKKGHQYSHYCGAQLLNILCCSDLIIDLIDSNPGDAKMWAAEAKKDIEILRNKIAALDILNKMKY